MNAKRIEVATINILKNGSETNISYPKKKGDIGYNVKAKSFEIVGEEVFDGNSKYYKKIDYISYDTGISLEPKMEEHFITQVGLGAPEEIESFDLPLTFSTFAFPRSSISKYQLKLANAVGIVDPPYRGTIQLRFKYEPKLDDFYKFKKQGCCGQVEEIEAIRVDMDAIYKVGDEIGQLVFIPFVLPNINVVDSLEATERGSDGFGSTGR